MNPPGVEHPQPLSRRLQEIADEPGVERITFSELGKRLHSRVWGGLLVIFAAINVLPLPPGTSTFIAIPILLVSGQMVFGRQTPWFPPRIDRRGVTIEELHRLIAKMAWFETRIERVFRPRLPHLSGPAATRLIGVICFLLGTIAALPILMIHNAPALAIVLFGLGLIYRDGVVIILAAIFAVLAVLFDAALIIWGVAAVKYVFGLAQTLNGGHSPRPSSALFIDRSRLLVI